MDFSSADFWVILLQIIWVNILLSGDNAVVIAMASRSLPKSQRLTSIAVGSGAAVILRIILTFLAAELLFLPGLKIAGSLLLIYIGISLVLPEDNNDEVNSSRNIWTAIRIILIADLVMSLDNILAVAAAAHGNFLLLIIGLALSIPLVVFGSTIFLHLMEKFPIIIWIGGGLLGYIAGDMIIADSIVRPFLEYIYNFNIEPEQFKFIMGAFGAFFVLFLGWIIPLLKQKKLSDG